METMQAYISGALSVAPGKVRLEVFYEGIGKICEGKKICAFIPHRDAGPQDGMDLTPHRLYRTNMQKISEADLVIAYVGHPSIGVGMEIQHASQNSKDVILIYDLKSAISKPLMGCPAVVDYIGFLDFDDAFQKLDTVLDGWILSYKQLLETRSKLAV